MCLAAFEVRNLSECLFGNRLEEALIESAIRASIYVKSWVLASKEFGFDFLDGSRAVGEIRCIS